MNFKNLKLVQKLFLGFGLMILIFLVYGGTVVFSIKKNSNAIDELNNLYDPLQSNILKLNDLSTKLKMYTTNWVYLRSNENDKQKLKAIIATDYKFLKSNISENELLTQDTLLKNDISSLFSKIENIIAISNTIQNSLQKFEDYEDPFLKLAAEDAIEIQIIPSTEEVSQLMNKIIEYTERQKDVKKNQIIKDFRYLSNLIWVLTILAIAFAMRMAFAITASLIKPIKNLNAVLSKLSKGKIIETTFEKRNDEIGVMYAELQTLSNGLGNIAHFADEIGKGNLEESFVPLSADDMIGNSLLKMRDELKSVQVADYQRNWITQGVANLGEILRNYNLSQEEFFDYILTEIVKYVKANLGGIFILNDENPEDLHLNMVACFAFDRKKFINKRIETIEGLVGMSHTEKDLIFLTEIPEDYMSIKSGLGDAAPACVVLLPLVVNENSVGVIELASFKVFEDYEIEYLKKATESIAAVVMNVKNNERNKKLLEAFESQQQSIREQEEEMRQNLEELVATQEEMQRKEAEYLEIIEKSGLKV